MRPSEYHAWDIQTLMSQSPVHPSGTNVPPHGDVEGEVTEMKTASDSGTSEAASTAERVRIFDVAHYHLKDLLLRVN